MAILTCVSSRAHCGKVTEIDPPTTAATTQPDDDDEDDQTLADDDEDVEEGTLSGHAAAQQQGQTQSQQEHGVMWIPGRVMHNAADRDMAQHVMDTLLRQGLLPQKLPADDSARMWIAI